MGKFFSLVICLNNRYFLANREWPSDYKGVMPFASCLYRDDQDQLDGDVGLQDMHPLGADAGVEGNIVKVRLCAYDLQTY